MVGGDDSQVGVLMDRELPAGGLATTALALDWTSRTLYFASQEPGELGTSLMASDTNGTRVVRIVTLNTLLNNILLLPHLGLMFLTDTDPNTGLQTITKAKMDGTGREVIFSTSAGEEISSLTSNFDVRDPRVYWIHQDQQKQSIVELQVDGNVRRNILTNLNNVTTLCCYKNKIYYARAEENNPIYIFEQDSVETIRERIFRNNTKAVLSLAVYDPGLQEVRLIFW